MCKKQQKATIGNILAQMVLSDTQELSDKRLSGNLVF